MGCDVVGGGRSCPNSGLVADRTAVSTMRRICGCKKLRLVLSWVEGLVDEGLADGSMDKGAGVGGKGGTGGWPQGR